MPIFRSTMRTPALRLLRFSAHAAFPSDLDKFCRKKSMTIRLILLVVIGAGMAASARRRPVLRDGLFKGHEFTPVEQFTDEFNDQFDYRKWYDRGHRWKGRQPGLFASKNVIQKGGKLFLRGVYEKPGSKAFRNAPRGYNTYTTAIVESKKYVKFGYFEVRVKPGNSRLSSSFWLALDTPYQWTEIDVFEIGGGAQAKGIDYRRRVNMNLHVFRNRRRGIKVGKNEISKPSYYLHSSLLRSRFNTYGLDWNRKYITWTLNGRPIRRDRNQYWRQEISVKFDVETMPNWFGLPSKKTLPAVYKIKYIRTWSRKRKPSSRRIRTTSRNERSAITNKQSRNMFGPGVSIPISKQNIQDADEDDEGSEEDNAETEVFEPTGPETEPPQDGLQRPPIPGSKEEIYKPVVPTMGRTWSEVIAEQNLALDDVYGAQIAPDEAINLSDFDEELILFSVGSGGSSIIVANNSVTTQPAAP